MPLAVHLHRDLIVYQDIHLTFRTELFLLEFITQPLKCLPDFQVSLVLG